MSTVTTNDGTQIYYKDWGNGPVIVLSHGWPLNADSWEDQALFLAEHGYRVIVHDRRGFGRSTQPWGGYDYDTFADDLAALFMALDLTGVALFGFSMGGGEVARYIGRHGTSRLSKAGLISSVPPLMLRTDVNPAGTPLGVFDGIRAAIRAGRSQFFQDLGHAFFGANREGSQGFARNARLVLVHGDAGFHQRHVRLHKGLLGDGLHRGFEEVRRADTGPPRR